VKDLRIAAAERLRIEYPESLPVSLKAGEIKAAWQESRLIIVGGETGSGKTTQLPKIALELGCGRNGMIGCTQPRRIAATAMARRLAQELNCTCGKEVGSQVRFDDRTTEETVLKFMTDGILLAELRNDPLFSRYDCIIIDEAHERSLNIDFLLGILRNIMPKRPDLKVAVSSATLDVERFREFFGDVPVIEVSGRTYPVEDIYLPPYEDEELSGHIARAVELLSGFDKRGDILVFLPGEREIREAAEMLMGRNYPDTEVMMLYSRLSSAEQQRVFHPGRSRRIILSTNVAETSLTIPRIKFCIDSGLARISRYNPRRGIQELQIEMISQASVRQRRGRCGRTADGICVHLYSEEEFAQFDAYTAPEIKRTSLAGVILQMANLHLPDIRTFPFIDPPPGQLIREGFRTLTDIKAVNDAGRITHEGRIIARLPADPHLGKMLLEAQKRKVLPEMLVLAAGLSIPDPRERPVEKPQAADQAHAPWKDENSDYTGWLNIWNALVSAGAFESNGNLRRFCRKNFLNFTRTREWRNLAADLADSMKEKFSIEVLENTSYQLLHESLLTGIPRNIAQLDTENRIYRGIDGKKFTIFPGSGVAKVKKLPQWIVCFAFVETRALFGRNAAVIEPEWVINAVPHLCSRSCDQEHFESSSGFVRAREKVSLGALQLVAGKKVDFARFNPAAAREIFIRDGLLAGMVSNVPAVEKFNAIRKKLLTYEERMRRPGQLYDEGAAEEFFRTHLPMEANSVQSLNNCFRKNAMRWNFAEKDFMNCEVDFSPADYPGKMEFAGVPFKLFYNFAPGEKNDGVMIAVPENSLNLLPAHLPEYPVPGYAADFAEAMMRALPKDIRRQIGGIPQCAALFADEFKRDASMVEIPAAEAMVDFLKTAVGLDIHPRLFDNVKMAEYLQLKIAVLNEAGRVKSIERTLPDRPGNSSKVSAALPGAEKHRESGWEKWDAAAGVIPQTVELPPESGKIFHCALHFDKEKDLISKELFIKQPEADRSHRRAVCALLMKENAQFVKILKRGIKFSNELKLTLMMNSNASDMEYDLLCSAIMNSTETDPVSVRSKADFERFSAEVMQNWSNTLDELTGELESFTKIYSEIRRLAQRAKAAAPAIEEHLELLFAPGFLKRPALFTGYRRYLRALTLRARRAADAPGKDMQKSEQLDHWIDRFNAALATLDDLTDSDGLYSFWELLEESRIAVFAPEVKSAVKSPVAKLEKAWEDLRI